MTDLKTKPVLLTGASGGLGRVLAAALAERGWILRLTDIKPFDAPLPPRASFTRADLEDGAATLRLAEGCGIILHFGGVSVEQPFEDVIGPNIRGLYHVYEAARREQARVVFASSNHTIGMVERTRTISTADPARPDGYYGLSKVYGEMMARLYWDKNAVETVSLRIGSCREAPDDARMLATWLSLPDLISLVEASMLAPEVGLATIWGVSDNAAMDWWKGDDRAKIGWQPRDRADGWRAQLQDVRGDAIAERFQGGAYCAIDYSRKS